MNEKIKNFLKETPMIIVMVLIMGIIVIPLPDLCLEILYSAECIFAIVIFVFSFTKLKRCLPRLVIIFSLFSLSIAIAITRVALIGYTNNSSAKLTDYFADIICENNYVIGFAISVILFIVQVIVLKKGNHRVIEVITTKIGKEGEMLTENDSTASEMNNEVDFYSSLDGASKFLGGECKALMFVLLVNLLGGIVNNFVINHKLSFTNEILERCVRNFAGNNIIFYLPILIVSMALGFCVTKNFMKKNR